MNGIAKLVVFAGLAALGACGGNRETAQSGPEPSLPSPQHGLLPSMTIASPATWGDRRPAVPEGYTITPIATDLKIPGRRWCCPTATSWWPKARVAVHRC